VVQEKAGVPSENLIRVMLKCQPFETWRAVYLWHPWPYRLLAGQEHDQIIPSTDVNDRDRELRVAHLAHTSCTQLQLQCMLLFTGEQV
jgi:hypothetical protein